jgi:uncharacterized protein (DUF305 family)
MQRIFVAAGLLAALTFPAFACDDSACPMKLHQGANGKVAAMSKHGGHGDGAGASINAMTRELDTAMSNMHKAMAVPYTGDADIDFLRGMIPHHQGAIDMSKIQLKYGRDPQVKRLAREIIRAQEAEIRWMSKWADQLEEKAKGPGTDKGWLGSRGNLNP